MSGSLDTNIVLRLLVHDVPEQTRQAATLLDCSAEQFAVADLVFVECAHVLERYYHMERSHIQTLLSEFMRLDKINCNRTMLRKALAPYTTRPNLSFEDCCLATYAELNEAVPLYTFDQKLARQLRGAELVYTNTSGKM